MMSRQFKGLFLGKHLLQRRDLTPKEKCVYAFIQTIFKMNKIQKYNFHYRDFQQCLNIGQTESHRLIKSLEMKSIISLTKIKSNKTVFWQIKTINK